MQISRIKLVAIAVAVLLVFSSAPCFAQNRNGDEEPTRKMDWLIWDSVERFTGQATVQLNTWIDRVSHGYYKEKTSSKSFATFHFELVREPQLYSVGHSRWIAGKVRVSGNEVSSSLDDSPTYRLAWSSRAEFDQEIVGDAGNLSLSLSHETGEFQMLLPSRLDTPVPDRIKRSEWNLNGKTINEERTELVYDAVSTLFNSRAPTDIGVLHATSENDYLEEDGRAGHRTTGRVVLVPEYSDFKVVVEFDSYDDKGKQVSYEDWRPFGSIREPGRAGNYIDVKAVLHPKRDMKPADLPKVKYFRFELVDTSREPGVAMNWPPKAKDKYPDLRLVVNPASPGLPDKEGQSLEVSRPVKDAEGRPAAMVRIDSYDFGGRTELKVTVELEDRRKLFGELESGDLSYNEIRIPKRDYGEWVADAWRIEHDVQNLPDDSDDESEPEGDGDNGDGLTLYEEYRGFAVKRMQGGRVEGDPERKDLFVLNLVGSDAIQGLKMFEEASGLHTIYQLVRPEIQEKDRVINRNYDKAPYRKNEEGKHNDQHALVLKTLNRKKMGHTGAEVRLNNKAKDGKGWRPKTISIVAMSDRDDPLVDTNQPWNLSTEDMAMQYEIFMIHEMLHAVGVGHHGEIDFSADYTYMPKTYKGNTAGQNLFYMREYQSNNNTVTRMAWVKVLEEKSGENWGDKIGPAFDDILERLTARKVAAENQPAATKFKDLDQQSQWDLLWELPKFYWKIGVEHGQHSGDEQCPMRYSYAQVYKARGTSGLQRETYYLVPQKSEDIGVVICESDKGSGVNGPKHKPQSRYGDATDGVGKCKKQICVNDALPLHSWGWRRP